MLQVAKSWNFWDSYNNYYRIFLGSTIMVFLRVPYNNHYRIYYRQLNYDTFGYHMINNKYIILEQSWYFLDFNK